MATEIAAPTNNSSLNEPAVDRRRLLTLQVCCRAVTPVPEVGGVSGLIVRDGKVLLIRRRNEPFADHWSLPGGGVEPGERLRDAVRREVLEETGLEVDVGRVAGYREGFEPFHHVVIAFHAREIRGRLCAGDDAAECEFVDPAEIFRRTVTPGLDDVFRDAGLLE